MNTKILSFIWKDPAIAVAVVAGTVGASQAGWSGTELVVDLPLMGLVEEFITGAFGLVGFTVAAESYLFVQSTANLYRVQQICTENSKTSAITTEFFGNSVATAVEDGRVKFVGAMEGALVVVIIAAPLGDEAISIISLRRANRKERKTLYV